MDGNIKYQALTESTYFILVSLITPLHGYGIMKKASDSSNNRVNLAPGTLYGALNSLLNKEYIFELKGSSSSSKKEYQITELGMEVLKSEITRLHELYNIGNSIVLNGGKIDEENR